MVRLKVQRLHRPRNRLGLFQFQSGAVKSANTPSVITAPAHFNSKVVRLKGVRRLRRLMRHADFNSKVVRLKARDISGSSRCAKISIPKWCG